MWLDHSIDDTWKEFRFITAELPMQQTQIFKLDWKPQVTSGYQILYFKILKFYLEITHCIFVILWMISHTSNPSFCIILANFLDAKSASCSLLAPVQTILPVWKMSAVVRGSRNRMIKPWNLAGLYSEFLVLALIIAKSSFVLRSTVVTQFLQLLS
jgi:hypothetical protein